MELWTQKRALEPNKYYRVQIGPLIFWLIRKNDEIHIAIERIGTEDFENDNVSFTETDIETHGKFDWQRWVVGADCSEISILPVMPDRPVVVRPDVPVKIPKDQEALFFVSIPAWIEISAEKKERIVLCQEPSVLRSNIWFGDTMSGELCYSLRSRARRQFTHIEPKPHRVACPVRIRNTTEYQFDVDRFCVHVEYLKIFEGTTRLWTNEVLIIHQGEDSISKIEYSRKAPKYEQTNGMISDARLSLKTTLLKKSIGTFKQLTGI